MVNSREEISVRVRKDGFVANLLLRKNVGVPMFYLKLCNHILFHFIKIVFKYVSGIVERFYKQKNNGRFPRGSLQKDEIYQ